MNGTPKRSAQEDGLLIRALARGETDALGPLLEHHLPRVYGLLRMSLPSGAEVEAALSDAFCAAAERASDPLARVDPEKWLAAIAVEQVERRSRPRPPASLAERRKRSERKEPASLGADAVAGISDEALAVLIRTLDLHSRQALVLGVISGLDDAEVARTIGCEPWEVEKLKRKALSGLAEKLVEHERREEELKRQIAAVPYKLKPHPVGNVGRGRGPAGSTVIVGHKVHLEPEQTRSFAEVIRRALKRVAELFRRHRNPVDLEDDAGDSGPQRTPEPTPSLRPFEKPSSTPTTRGYRNPKLSPGVAVYTMPRGTPTTRRISNRRNPLKGSDR